MSPDSLRRGTSPYSSAPTSAEDGSPILEVAHDAEGDCTVVEVEQRDYQEYLGYALWYHRGPTFRTLQIVWPSKATRRFPL